MKRITLTVDNVANVNAIINFAHAHGGMLEELETVKSSRSQSTAKPTTGINSKVFMIKAGVVASGCRKADSWAAEIWKACRKKKKGFTVEDIRQTFTIHDTSEQSAFMAGFRDLYKKGVFEEVGS